MVVDAAQWSVAPHTTPHPHHITVGQYSTSHTTSPWDSVTLHTTPHLITSPWDSVAPHTTPHLHHITVGQCGTSHHITVGQCGTSHLTPHHRGTVWHLTPQWNSVGLLSISPRGGEGGWEGREPHRATAKQHSQHNGEKIQNRSSREQ